MISNNHQRAAARLLVQPVGTLLGTKVCVDVYQRSGFRLLGLHGDAQRQETASARQQFTTRMKSGAEKARARAIRTGYEDVHLLDEQAMLESVQCLQDARRRLVAELFWVSGEAELDAVRRRGTLETTALAQVVNRPSIAIQHAKALLAHNEAIAVELSSQQVATSHWSNALALWSEVHRSSAFWTRMASRVRELDDPRVDQSVLEELRAQLPPAVLGFHVAFAEHYTQRDKLDHAMAHLRLVQQSSFVEEVRSSVAKRLVAAIVGAMLNTALTQAQSELVNVSKMPWSQFRNRCAPLLDKAVAVAEYATDSLGLHPGAIPHELFDSFAKSVLSGLNGSIDYQNDDSRPKALIYSLTTTKRLLELPLGSIARIELKEAFAKDCRIIYGDYVNGAKDFDPSLCHFAPSLLADPDSTIVVSMHKITKLTAGSANWNMRKVIIPRSSRARAFHEGRQLSPATLPESELTPFERKAKREISNLQRQVDGTKQAFDEQYEREHTLALTGPLAAVQATIDTLQARLSPLSQQIDSTEQDYEQERKSSEDSLEAECLDVEMQHEDELSRLRQAKGLRATLASVLGVVVLGLGVAIYVNLDKLEEQKSSMVAAGVALLAFIAVLVSFFGGKAKCRALRASIDSEIAEKRQEFVERETVRRAAFDANIAPLIQERDALASQLEPHRATIAAHLEPLQKQHAQRVQTACADGLARIAHLGQSVVANFNVLPESTKTDFGPYRALDRQGYKLGERPSASWVQSEMKSKMQTLLYSLDELDRKILAVLSARLNEDAFIKVIEQVEESPSYRRSSIIRGFINL
jgi:hypothetical protein